MKNHAIMGDIIKTIINAKQCFKKQILSEDSFKKFKNILRDYRNVCESILTKSKTQFYIIKAKHKNYLKNSQLMQISIKEMIECEELMKKFENIYKFITNCESLEKDNKIQTKVKSKQILNLEKTLTKQTNKFK